MGIILRMLSEQEIENITESQVREMLTGEALDKFEETLELHNQSAGDTQMQAVVMVSLHMMMEVGRDALVIAMKKGLGTDDPDVVRFATVIRDYGTLLSKTNLPDDPEAERAVRYFLGLGDDTPLF